MNSEFKKKLNWKVKQEIIAEWNLHINSEHEL